MKLNDMVDSITRDIQHQAERLLVYQEIERMFRDVDAAQGCNIYGYKSGSSIYVEFSPEYGDESNKDLRPLVHKLTRKFHAKFSKRKSYDGTAIEYSAEINLDPENPEKILRLKVAGVVPQTCRYEEEVTLLTDDEIETARQEAIASVQTTKVTRKLVCR